MSRIDIPKIFSNFAETPPTPLSVLVCAQIADNFVHISGLTPTRPDDWSAGNIYLNIGPIWSKCQRQISSSHIGRVRRKSSYLFVQLPAPLRKERSETLRPPSPATVGNPSPGSAATHNCQESDLPADDSWRQLLPPRRFSKMWRS